MDCSPVALKLAEQNLSEAHFSRRLVQGDFFRDLTSLSGSFDVVFIGLSLHHLPALDKGKFLASLRPRINPGGGLVFFEPAFQEGELRADYMERFSSHAHASFSSMSPEQIREMVVHVTGADFPESPSRFCQLATEAGFASADMIYSDEDQLLAMIACGTLPRM